MQHDIKTARGLNGRWHARCTKECGWVGSDEGYPTEAAALNAGDDHVMAAS